MDMPIRISEQEIQQRRQTILTPTAAARIIGVCRKTIYTWISTGRVQTIEIPGGGKRIVAESLWQHAEQPVKPWIRRGERNVAK